MNTKQKLNIIIYNKHFQKEQGINIEDYKKISGKYKICENGKGKEYLLNTTILIYEDEYFKKKEMVKEKNFIIMGIWNLKENILMGKYGTEKDIIQKAILNLK